MVTSIDLQKKIHDSSWPQDAINLTVPNLPSIGYSTLDYLDTNFKDFRGNTAISIAEFISQVPVWLEGINRENNQDLMLTLEKVSSKRNVQEIAFLLAFLNDLHQNKVISSKIPHPLHRAISIFLLAYSENVSVKDISLGLLLNPADLGMIFSLESELKRFAYYKNYQPDSKEIDLLFDHLERSEQVLSNQQIVIDGANVKCNVQNIIKDFNIYSSKLPERGSSYAVAQYITSSPTIKSFDETTTVVITRILEAYTWLLGGIVSEKEVIQYESAREQILDNLGDLISTIPSKAFTLSESYEVELDDEDDSSVDASITPEPPAPQIRPMDLPRPSILTLPSEMTKSMGAPAPAPVPTPKPAPLPQSKPGVVKDPTNIVVADEQERLEQERKLKSESIARKLADLKARNKQP